MAEANSYATFASANYPAESDTLNTAPVYGDAINVLNGSYDPGAAPPQLAAADVRKGTNTGANGPGTLEVPPAGKVILGVATDNTVGTYAQLAVANAITGSSWGEDGTEFAGIYDEPLTTNVILNTTFGPGGSLVGVNRQAVVANVLDGYAYGPNDTLIGELETEGGGECGGYPLETTVAVNTVYGQFNELTGNRTDALEEDVRLGKSYAANGVSKTGTWNGETGDPGDQTWIGQ